MHEIKVKKMPDPDEEDLTETLPDDLIIEEEDLEGVEAEPEEHNVFQGEDADLLSTYLGQMGQIPLLSREKELLLAKNIDHFRQAFRTLILSFIPNFNTAIDLVEAVTTEERAFDRTLKLAENGIKLKDSIMDKLIKRVKDLRVVQSRIKIATNESVIRSHLKVGIRMVEECGLQIKFLQDMYKNMLHIKPETYSESKYRLPWEEFDRRIKLTKEKFDHYENAKKDLANGNLRLVVSIAKKYRGKRVSFLDIIQEGNAGLMKAVEKYEYQRGYKFSTYATWWIRQSISRSLSDASRTIRIPVHIAEIMSKIKAASKRLSQGNGREPTPEEIAEETGVSVQEVYRILKVSKQPISLDKPITENSEEGNFGDFLEDKRGETPLGAANKGLLKEKLLEVLDSLTFREREILKLRTGIGDGYLYTLEECGKIFKITRERVRQIEAKALRKLRHPIRSRKLEGFLDSSSKEIDEEEEFLDE